MKNFKRKLINSNLNLRKPVVKKNDFVLLLALFKIKNCLINKNLIQFTDRCENHFS